MQVRDGESRDSHNGAGDKGEGEPHPEFLIPVEDDGRCDAKAKAKTAPGPSKRQDGFPFSRVGRFGPVPSRFEQPGP